MSTLDKLITIINETGPNYFGKTRQMLDRE